MIARAYGPDQVPTGDDWVQELGIGLFNVAYRLRLRDGYESVLKIAPPPSVRVMTYERGAMATELAALALVRYRTTVPVPVVDFADQSHQLCDADYFFMPYIDADNLSVVRMHSPKTSGWPTGKRSAPRPSSSMQSVARHSDRSTDPARSAGARPSCTTGT